MAAQLLSHLRSGNIGRFDRFPFAAGAPGVSQVLYDAYLFDHPIITDIAKTTYVITPGEKR